MSRGSPQAIARALVRASPARRARMLRDTPRVTEVAEALRRMADEALGRDARLGLRIAAVALDLGSASRDPLALAHGQRARARALHRCLRYREAAVLYAAAARGYARLGLSSEQASVEMGLVPVLFRSGRLAEAQRSARQARRHFAAAGDRLGQARVLVNLGNLRHLQDRHQEAIRLWSRARPAHQHAADRPGLASIDHNLAVAHSMLARFDRSGVLFARARQEFLALGQDEMVARLDYNLGYDHFLQGRFHEARRRIGQARQAFRRTGSRQGLALASRDDAEMALALGLPEQAAEAAEEARRIFQQEGAALEAARARLFEAEAALRRGASLRAASHLAAARLAFRRLAHDPGLAAADLAAARNPALVPRERLRRAEAAAAVFARHGMTARHAAALVAAGTVELEWGRADSARRRLRRAIALARPRGLREVELRGEHALGRAAREDGEGRVALAHFRRAIAAYERLREGIRSDLDRLAFASDRAVVFEDAVGTALDLGRSEEAFDLVERARARALVDLLATDPRFTAATMRGGSALLRRLTRLKRQMRGLDAHVRHRERKAEAPPRAFATVLRRVVAEQDEAFARLERREPEMSYALSGRPIVSLEQVRATLGPERALLSYFLDGEQVGALLVTDHEVVPFRGLTRRCEIERELETLHFALGAPRLDPPRRPEQEAFLAASAMRRLERLRTLLLAPVEARLGERALVVVLPAALHAVPFQALARRGCPLVEEREVSFAPSASVLVRAVGRKRATGGALVIAVPDEAAPAIDREAKEIARRLQARLLTGSAATAAAVRREVSGASIVHVAAHGIYDPADRLMSGLQLADGLLTVPEMAALDLGGSLVTLSACESAAGQPHGDEVLGLTRAVLHAGARALVASLWAVHDASTAELMLALYAGIRDGLGIAAALRAATRKLRRAYPHPYHWAPFLLVGGWDPIEAAYNEETLPHTAMESR